MAAVSITVQTAAAVGATVRVANKSSVFDPNAPIVTTGGADSNGRATFSVEEQRDYWAAWQDGAGKWQAVSFTTRAGIPSGTGPQGPAGPPASDASVSVKGLSRLSHPPASGSDPIAVGDNDPRLSGAVVVLTPPANLTATAGIQTVSLSWSTGSGPNLAGYNIYRQNADGSWPTAPLVQVNTPNQAYQDQGLANGTTYRYRVTSRNASGIESAAVSPTVEATPTGPNQPPVPGFTFSPNQPLVSATVTFTSTSTDPDGSIVSTQWDFTNNGTFDATGSQVTNAFGVAGTYTVRMRVTDNQGATAETTQQIQVVAAPVNQAPIASFTISPASPVAGQIVTFTSTSSDPDGTIANTQWDFTNDGSFDATGTPATRIYAAGTYTVRLRVTDNLGAIGEVTQQLTVAAAPNQPPTAAFSFAPVSPVVSGTSVTFTSTSSDPDGSIALTEWDWTNDGTFESTGTPVAHTFPNPGTFTVRLRVTDNQGAQATTTQQITVTNRAPVAAFTVSPVSPVVGQAATFTSQSSDPDGTIVSEEWDFTNNGSIDATGNVVTNIYGSTGTVTVRLRVTDDSGAATETTQSVTVIAVPASTYSTEVLADTPRVYYRLAEPSGTSVTDSSGNALTATYSGSPTLGVAGAISGNNAVTFDGVNDKVQRANNALFDVNDTFTIEFWVKRSATQGVVQTLYVKVGQNGPAIVFAADNKIEVFYFGVAGDCVKSTIAITDQTWHYVVFTSDGTTTGKKLYIDNIDRTGTVTAGTFFNTSGDLRLGSDDPDVAWFPGSLDEFALYPTVLSSARRTAHYNAAVGDLYRTEVMADTPGVFLRLSDAASPAQDETANNLDATAVGGVTFSAAGALVGNAAVALNGSSGYLEVADNAAIDVADVCTLEIWVKRGTIGSKQQLMSKGTGTFGLYLDTDNKVKFEKVGTGVIVDSGSTTLTDTTNWHFICVTKNAGTVKLYVDGLDATGTVTNQTLANNATVMRIGATTGTAAEFLNGTVDEPAVFPTALTSTRMLAHYHAAGYSEVIPPPPPPVTGDRAGWIGNSNAGVGDDHIPHHAQGFYTHPDGTCYSNTFWEEHGHECRAYKAANGQCVGVFSDMHGNSGRCVTADATYVYFGGQPSGGQVRRWLRSDFENPANISRGGGSAVPHTDIPVSPNDPIFGAAVFGNELFISTPGPDWFNAGIAGADNRGPFPSSDIRVYNLTTLQQVRSWGVPRARHLAFDRQGFLWVLQQDTGATLTKAIRYDRNGVLQGQSVTATGSQYFTDIACDPSADRILIADNGPDQNIKIFNTQTGASITTFGTTGGYLSTAGGVPKGTYGDLRFDGPRGVGIDSAGNIYVMHTRSALIGSRIWAFTDQGHGTTIESYTAAGALRWRKQGLMYGDCGDLDTATGTDVYTGDRRLSVNFDTNPVTWSVKAVTEDPAYAAAAPWASRTQTSDTNTHSWPAYIRNFAGAKFLFIQDSGYFTKNIIIYRFAAGSEIAIPCGHFYNGEGPPGSQALIEVDTTGDGSLDSTLSGLAWSVRAFHIAPNGDVWVPAGENEVWRYRMAGLNGIGAPTYNHTTHKDVWAKPAEFDRIRRLRWLANVGGASDVAIIAGFRPGSFNPNDYEQGKMIGNRIARYNNWSGARTLAWAIDIPYNPGNGAKAIGFDVAGDYMVTADFNNGFNGHGGPWRIYRLSDGALYKGPWDDAFFSQVEDERGWLDIIERATSMEKRSDGLYVVISEENQKSKLLTMQFT